jgi:hypothetical protein
LSDVPEHDLQLLESYLDDALAASQVEVVDARLAREPRLGEALGSLRAQRAVRAAVWQAIQGDGHATEALSQRLRRGITRHELMTRLLRGLRVGGGVAACVALVWGGWMIRGASAPSVARVVGPVPARHAVVPVDAAGIYRVALTDEAGKVIAVQPFTKLDDARQFADDLERYEARRREVRQGSAVLVSDHF